MRRWTAVRVVWRDACGSDESAWVETHNVRDKPTKVTTVGQLFKQNKHGISVVLSRNDGRIGAFIFIPAENIISLKELKEH